MTPLTSVFVVQHLHIHGNGEECVKLIGVYENRSAAQQAVGRVNSQPGFCDYPKIIDPLQDEEGSGFYIDEYSLGKDHWTEGYTTELK
jgi:hypothetical protein